MSTLKLFGSTAGLNNRVDPVRLRYSPKEGVVDLSQAVDIVIDDTGRPNRAKGRSLISAGVFHSLYKTKHGDCFVAQDRTSDAALYQAASDLTLTGVRSSLTKAARISFCQVNYQTYYTNGTQRGYIEDGVSAAWPVQTYSGTTTRRDLAVPPIGTMLGFHQGHMIIVEDNTAWFTEHFQFGLLDREQMFVRFMSNIRMVAPVDGGVFFSDEHRTYFMAGTNPINFSERIVADYPAHQWSMWSDLIPASDINPELPESARCRVWSSTDGTCVGLPDGSLINLTNKRIKYPDISTTGATLVCDGSFGKQVIACT